MFGLFALLKTFVDWSLSLFCTLTKGLIYFILFIVSLIFFFLSISVIIVLFLILFELFIPSNFEDSLDGRRFWPMYARKRRKSRSLQGIHILETFVYRFMKKIYFIAYHNLRCVQYKIYSHRRIARNIIYNSKYYVYWSSCNMDTSI